MVKNTAKYRVTIAPKMRNFYPSGVAGVAPKMRIFARLLLLLALALPALGETDLSINLTDSRLRAAPYYTNREVWVQPMSTPTAQSPSVVLGARIIGTTDTNGILIISNSQPLLYFVQVRAPPQLETFMVFVTATNLGLINAADNLVASSTATFPAGAVAWAAAVSDSRYARVGANGGWTAAGTNVIATTNLSIVTVNATVSPGYVTNVAQAVTNPLGSAAFSFTTNFDAAGTALNATNGLAGVLGSIAYSNAASYAAGHVSNPSNYQSATGVTNIANALISGANTGFSTNALNATNLWGLLSLTNLPATATNQLVLTNDSRAMTLTNALNAFTGIYLGNGGALSNINGQSVTGAVATATAALNATNFWGLLSATNIPTGLTNQFVATNDTRGVLLTNKNNVLAGTIGGDGSGLSNLNSGQFSSTTTNAINAQNATNVWAVLSVTNIPVQATNQLVLTNDVRAVNLTNVANQFAGTFTGGQTNFPASAITNGVVVTNFSIAAVLNTPIITNSGVSGQSVRLGVSAMSSPFTGNGISASGLIPTELEVADKLQVDGLNASQLVASDSNKQLLSVPYGTITNSLTWTNDGRALSLTNSGNQFIGIFNGNGSGLTNLPAAAFTNTPALATNAINSTNFWGTLSNSNLPPGVVTQNYATSWTAYAPISVYQNTSVTPTNNVTALTLRSGGTDILSMQNATSNKVSWVDSGGQYHGDGGGLTNLSVSSINTVPSATNATYVTTAQLTNLVYGSNVVAGGTIPVSAVPVNATNQLTLTNDARSLSFLNTSNVFVGTHSNAAFTGLASNLTATATVIHTNLVLTNAANGNSWVVSDSTSPGTTLAVQYPGIGNIATFQTNGTVTATTFSGTLSGNAASATLATYVSQSPLTNKVNAIPLTNGAGYNLSIYPAAGGNLPLYVNTFSSATNMAVFENNLLNHSSVGASGGLNIGGLIDPGVGCITASGNVAIGGNVTASGFFYGNGANLTNLPGGNGGIFLAAGQNVTASTNINLVTMSVTSLTNIAPFDTQIALTNSGLNLSDKLFFTGNGQFGRMLSISNSGFYALGYVGNGVGLTNLASVPSTIPNGLANQGKFSFNTNYSMTVTQQIYFCNGTNQVITLLNCTNAANPPGVIYRFTSTNANGSFYVTNANGVQTVGDGVSPAKTNSGVGVIRLVHDGAAWWTM